MSVLPGNGALQRGEAEVHNLKLLAQPVLLRREDAILLGAVKSRYDIPSDCKFLLDEAD